MQVRCPPGRRDGVERVGTALAGALSPVRAHSAASFPPRAHPAAPRFWVQRPGSGCSTSFEPRPAAGSRADVAPISLERRRPHPHPGDKCASWAYVKERWHGHLGCRPMRLLESAEMVSLPGPPSASSQAPGGGRCATWGGGAPSSPRRPPPGSTSAPRRSPPPPRQELKESPVSFWHQHPP